MCHVGASNEGVLPPLGNQTLASGYSMGCVPHTMVACGGTF